MRDASQIRRLIAELAPLPPAGHELLTAKFRQLVNKNCVETLDALFFECYLCLPALAPFTKLRAVLCLFSCGEPVNSKIIET